MKFYEALIIYLALGAPFAVYQYFQTRKLNPLHQSVQIALSLLFWFPLAVFRAIRRAFQGRDRLAFASSGNSDSRGETRIRAIEDEIKRELLSTGSKNTAREFCEIFERYTGLSEALVAADLHPTRREREIFIFTNHANADLAAICINRRNHRRLELHRDNALTDLLRFLEDLGYNNLSIQPILRACIDAANLLGDFETAENIKKTLLKTVNEQRISPQPVFHNAHSSASISTMPNVE